MEKAPIIAIIAFVVIFTTHRYYERYLFKWRSFYFLLLKYNNDEFHRVFTKKYYSLNFYIKEKGRSASIQAISNAFKNSEAQLLLTEIEYHDNERIRLANIQNYGSANEQRDIRKEKTVAFYELLGKPSL